MKDLNKELKAIRREIELLTNNTRIAAAAYALYKPAASDKALLERLGTSRATLGFNFVRDAIHQRCVLAILACWDNAGGALSIVKTLKRISEPTVLNALREARERDWLNIPVLTRDPTEPAEDKMLVERALARMAAADAKRALEDFDRGYARLNELVAAVVEDKDGKPLGALTRLRNSKLAHTETADWSEYPISARPKARAAVYGDERLLIDATIEIVRLLNEVVLNASIDIGTHIRTYERAAKSFWAPVSGEKPSR